MATLSTPVRAPGLATPSSRGLQTRTTCGLVGALRGRCSAGLDGVLRLLREVWRNCRPSLIVTAADAHVLAVRACRWRLKARAACAQRAKTCTEQRPAECWRGISPKNGAPTEVLASLARPSPAMPWPRRDRRLRRIKGTIVRR